MKEILRPPSRQMLADGTTRALERFIDRQAMSHPLLVNPFAIGYRGLLETARRGGRSSPTPPRSVSSPPSSPLPPRARGARSLR
jgi:hypothetical protein